MVRRVVNRPTDDHPARPTSSGAEPERAMPEEGVEEKREHSLLSGLPATWIDRLLPRRPRPFLLVVLGLAGGFWLLGLTLATDRKAFLASTEWRIQPLFLAGHLVTLRLFVSCYVRNYLRGVHHLDASPALAKQWTLSLLRPLGGLVALALAAPFCAYDIASLDQYVLVPDDGVRAVDVLLCVVWCFEWVMNAYIWFMLVGFACLSSWTIRQHAFRSPLQTVIQLKQYRPFLLMSVQGSTILVFFGALYGLYVWYADGDMSDFVSLGITLVLLLGCFVPPWLLLRNRLEGELRRQQEAISHRLVGIQALGEQPNTPEVMARRLDEAVALLRLTHLERLQQELGAAEGRAVVMRLLIPVSTVLVKVLRPFLIGL